jgi:hypothetical protein
MSYLHPPRLHFSGKFLAAISTVNNDPLHFDNTAFRPSYQERQAGDDPSQWNGWFNPQGSGDWRLLDCRVESALMSDGNLAPKSDPVLATFVADSERGAPAKLVDLDPEQQLVSMIWGLEVRIVTAAGNTLLRGHFEPVAFIDIWDRSPGGTTGDVGAGAMYQSVLTDLAWNDRASSPFLRELRDKAVDGVLSIKFNVDGINLDFDSPEFMTGRIVGSIGVASAGEPRHFVLGRQFMARATPGGDFFTPSRKVNFCTGVLDPETRRIYLDLGNALPTVKPGGRMADLGDLALYQIPPPDPSGTPLLIGSLPAARYTVPSWYRTTAGIAVFPSDRELTADEYTRLDDNPLALITAPSGGGSSTPVTEKSPVGVFEPPAGGFVRADQFVFRLNPEEGVTADVYATRFGHPYQGATVITVPVPGQLQQSSQIGQAPQVAMPADAIDYDSRIITNEHGVAQLRILARDPHHQRGYIDGQVYAIYPVLEDTIISPSNPYHHNQWNFISLLVWDGFQPDDPPTWFGSIRPIFQQYANLYPVMKRFLDLGSYDSVCKNIQLLTFAFGLDTANPNSMPVTRDLSAAKRAAILRWLTDLPEDGMPRKGEEERVVTTVTQPAGAGPESRHEAGYQAVRPKLGGKASAANRRPVARRPSTADSLKQLMGEGAGDPDQS